ncbi:MAG TPA: aldolase/citrate lyase family protein [Gammaproteobacteria bacterium]|nr:aldolase/citrate lyase family protein [Gammaproteobacteria bacterium]
MGGKTFRQRLRAGEQLFGTLVSLHSADVAELLSKAGFDWLFIDTEHGAFDPAQAQALLQAVGDRCPCLIRVPAGEEVSIKKALDVGAAGVIVPQVNTAQDAARVVKLCKYPPVGTRGVGIARAHGYGYGFADYIASANEEVAVVLQIEHIDGVNNIRDIIRVADIDAVFIGPYDLSASMGRTGQVDDPEVQKAIATVRDVALAAGLKLGIFGISAAAVKPYAAQGFTLLTAGCDTIFLSNAAQQTLAVLRE